MASGARTPDLPAVTLFVSDLHLGRGAAADERAKAAAFAAWLDAHGAARALYLVGDVFEAWVEYRHLVPRPPARVLGALARYVDGGGRLVVFAGNHDPWHRSYFADEFGAEVVFDGRTEPVEGRRVHVHHGDGLGPGGLYRRLRGVLRHPLPVALYRGLLPADAGVALARAVARRITHDAPDGAEADALRTVAAARLARGDVEAVVFGHTHVPALAALPGGVYVNPGAWHVSRTYAVLDADGFRLGRWTDAGAVPFAPA